MLPTTDLGFHLRLVANGVNCRSLGFARDDKGKGNCSIGSSCWTDEKRLGPATTSMQPQSPCHEM